MSVSSGKFRINYVTKKNLLRFTLKSVVTNDLIFIMNEIKSKFVKIYAKIRYASIRFMSQIKADEVINFVENVDLLPTT